MCGIFGAVGRPVGGAATERILTAIQHRGPDGDGVFVDEADQVTLVHTRLAVIDLLTGAQPLTNEDGSIILIANGEIYGFEEIRISLEANGHRFRTHSDSEIIIHLYEEYGLQGCLERLRGEFAFLLYDRARRLLVAARDRFGIKPLYFSRLQPGYAFASEMKAIFASELVEPRLNVEALDPLLNQDAQNVRFPFEGIEHVPPGCVMTVDLETLDSTVSPYWSAEIPASSAEPAPGVPGEAEKWADEVLEKLEEAVRLRLRADVPVGLYLSGGIDSSFVGALMKRNLPTQLHSFSISFVGSARNEQEFTRQAAAFLGTRHHDLELTKQMLWDNLEDCLWFTELPFVSLAPVGYFLLSAEARKRVTVVLNGQGADEVFLGYRSFFQNAMRSDGQGSSARMARLKLTALPPSVVERLSLRIFHKRHRRSLASARGGGSQQADASKPLINQVQESRIAEMPIDILGFLGDRVEMAHSLEARVPFLDHKLFDAAKRIPAGLKMRGGVEKAVLRDAAKGIIPEEIRLRRKQGFMLTSEAVDLFGADREPMRRFGRYLSKEAFQRWGVFSYRAYRIASLVARLPDSVPSLRRARRYANKLIFYMMQTHMLADMFIAEPRWGEKVDDASANRPAAREPSFG